ncbi:MAG: CoA pyrophosphatase [bacterium]|nr:CoA pyrophosphatase [bacterium]
MLDYIALRHLLETNRPACREAPAGYERNSVCLLLADRVETVLVAIEKPASEGYHWSGQVALAGGRIEADDPTAEHAARRELHEELGIPPEEVEVLGELGHFQTETSDHDLAVFVGRWVHPGDVHADSREVARVLEIPLGDLVGLHTSRGYHGQPAGAFGEGLAYPIADARIWGVTARILHHFVELLLDNHIST